MFAEWEERRVRLQQQLPFIAAKASLKNILERIPKTDEMKPYRMALEVCRVLGLGKDEAAYAVRLNPKHRKIRTVDVSREILYVTPRDLPQKVKEEVLVLERYSPWTPETIPFMPKQSEAFIRFVKVGRQLALRVQKRRARDRRKWQKELSTLGFRNEARRVKAKPKFRYRRKLPPIVLDALSMEFGLDKKALPHWGPGIRRFAFIGVRSLRRKHPGLTSVLTKLGFRTWRNWPTRVRNRIRLQEAQGFVAFQKKLGIRTTG